MLRKTGLKPYGVSIFSVFAAIILTLAIEPALGGKAPMFFFTIAVIVSAVYGLGPGLLATALSIGSVLLLFREIFTMVLVHSNVILFAVVGVGVSVVMGRLQQANSALLKSQRALQAANEQLSEQSRVLSRSNEELRRFAYALAHDLNTPIRAISALTDLLVQRNAARLDESSKECARLIAGKTVRMQAMIKGLLDYAAAADKSTAWTRVEADALVQRAMRDLDLMIASSGAEITVDRLPIIAAAETQLVQVFSNLISNAIKYCPRGRKPHIQISAKEQSDILVFCVKDNGIGMDMQYAEIIFGMFKRLHGEEYEGSGIGLALCRAVIESHGGRIWLESQIGQGTSFYFTLPNPRATAQAGREPREDQSGAASALPIAVSGQRSASELKAES